jgi:hypothetical protein
MQQKQRGTSKVPLTAWEARKTPYWALSLVTAHWKGKVSMFALMDLELFLMTVSR